LAHFKKAAEKDEGTLFDFSTVPSALCERYFTSKTKRGSSHYRSNWGALRPVVRKSISHNQGLGNS